VVFRRQEISARFWRDLALQDAETEALLKEVVNGGQIAVGLADIPVGAAGDCRALRQCGAAPGPLHVLLGFVGFRVGGAEVLPVHLANALTAAGLTVSMFAEQNSGEHLELRRRLNPKVAVYRRENL